MTDSITVETYAPHTDTPELIGTETIEVPLSEHDLERRDIVSQWQGRKQAVIDALAGIEAQRDTIIAANAAVQQATKTTQVVAAIKAYAQANLVVLGALETHTSATANALGIIERAIIWLDAELAEMGEDGP